MKEKKDPGDPGSLPLSLVLLLFLFCNPRFPFVYKRGSRAPHGGGEETQDQNTRARHEHTIELSAPVHSFHQRLGTISLSRLFVTPTTNFQC